MSKTRSVYLDTRSIYCIIIEQMSFISSLYALGCCFVEDVPLDRSVLAFLCLRQPMLVSTSSQHKSGPH